MFTIRWTLMVVIGRVLSECVLIEVTFLTVGLTLRGFNSRRQRAWPVRPSITQIDLAATGH